MDTIVGSGSLLHGELDERKQGPCYDPYTALSKVLSGDAFLEALNLFKRLAERGKYNNERLSQLGFFCAYYSCQRNGIWKDPRLLAAKLDVTQSAARGALSFWSEVRSG